MPKLTQSLIERMYDPDLSDTDNAKRVGCSRWSISSWRLANGYKSKFGNTRINSEKVRELHSIGLSDPEIARNIGVSGPGVRKCRERLGLALNRCAKGRPRRQTSDTKQSMVKAKRIEFETDDPESLFCDGEFLEQFKNGEFGERSH